MDVRALQEPSRAPRTAAYLEGLLGAFDAAPSSGESFAFLLASDEDDPTRRYERLEVIGRRLLPPTRLLRSAALTVDPFILRGASVGAAWRAGESGAYGAVYHTAGGGLPIASSLPTIVTLLDLAPWELPAAFQRSVASRFGQRLRARLLRDAAAILVGTDAVAGAARRLLHLRRDSIRVVPLAPRPAYAVGPMALAERAAETRTIVERLGLADRYLVYPGRHDIRHDAATMLAALASLARRERPDDLAAEAPWPPRVLVLDTTPDDRAALARIAARHSAGDHLVYAPNRAAWPHSTRSQRGCRSSPRQSGHSPRSSARPGSWSSRAIGSGWQRHSAQCGATRRSAPAWWELPGNGPRATGLCHGPGPTWPPTCGRSTPRSGGGSERYVRAYFIFQYGGVGRGGGAFPSLITILEPFGMTWMNVWPTVNVTGLPLAS
jgi:hypothetical protein